MTENVVLLVEEYIQGAVAHGNATLAGDYKLANHQYRKLTRIYKKIAKNRELALTFFSDLFQHPNASVRTWAAAHSLGLGIQTQSALKVLEQISQDHNIGIVRLDAEMTLKEWIKKGELKF